MIKAIIFDFFGVINVNRDGQAELDEELLNYIGELKGSYKIALMSNVERLDEHVDRRRFEELFDVVAPSGEVGLTKPDSRFFEHVLNKLDVAANKAVMVDDIARYCQAAENLGMQSIVYKNFEQFRAEFGKILSF